QFCPLPSCPYYGRVGLGNIRANGYPSGGCWRQFQCRSCQTYFLETHGTICHGKRVASERLGWALAALAEGLGIRARARVFAVDPNTVLAWLVEAATHLQALSRVLSQTLGGDERNYHFLLSTQPRRRTALLEFGTRFRWFPVVPCEWHA